MYFKKEVLIHLWFYIYVHRILWGFWFYFCYWFLIRCNSFTTLPSFSKKNHHQPINIPTAGTQASYRCESVAFTLLLHKQTITCTKSLPNAHTHYTIMYVSNLKFSPMSFLNEVSNDIYRNQFVLLSVIPRHLVTVKKTLLVVAGKRFPWNVYTIWN